MEAIKVWMANIGLHVCRGMGIMTRDRQSLDIEPDSSMSCVCSSCSGVSLNIGEDALFVARGPELNKGIVVVLDECLLQLVCDLV